MTDQPERTNTPRTDIARQFSVHVSEWHLSPFDQCRDPECKRAIELERALDEKEKRETDEVKE